MKKICFVTTVYGTYRSFLRELSIFLHESGEYEISLICDGSSIIEDNVPSFVKVFPIRMKRGISLSGLHAISTIKKIIKSNKFDIVQYSTPNAAFYTSIAALIAKTPVRLYCQWGIRYMGFVGWKRGIFKILEKITCSNSTFVEAESHNIREFSIKERLYKEEKSCVIWNGSASGVNLKKFNYELREEWRKEIREKLHLREDEIVFAFAGRLTADKGVNELLEAFLNLLEKNEKIKLLVMGSVDNEKTLNHGLMNKAKNSSSIIFTGRVSELEKYYAATDIFVSPSYREGFGLVVIEAEAMGVPAIVSNVPGQLDAIIENETGISCQVRDTKALYIAMEKMYKDSLLRENMSKAAYKFAKENFDQTVLFKFLKDHRDEMLITSKKKKRKPFKRGEI